MPTFRSQDDFAPIEPQPVGDTSWAPAAQLDSELVVRLQQMAHEQRQSERVALAAVILASLMLGGLMLIVFFALGKWVLS